MKGSERYALLFFVNSHYLCHVTLIYGYSVMLMYSFPRPPHLNITLLKFLLNLSLSYCRIAVYMLGDNHIWQQLVFTVIPISVTAWHCVVYGW